MAFTTPITWDVAHLVLAADLNVYQRDNINALNSNGLLPNGIIVPFADVAASIPATGWHVNDGGGSTIDLRDVFVVGAGSTYAVGASGGNVSNTPGAHSTHVVTQPSHSVHVVTTNTHSTFLFAISGGAVYADGNSGAHSGAALSGANTHANAALDAHSAHPAISLLPPYHARPFMQTVASGLSFTTPRTWTTSEVPTAAQFNTEFRDNPNYLYAISLPRKSILYWSSTIASIPTSFALCDGTGGTVDLRDKFIVGAGNLYNPGDIGGSVAVTMAAHSSHAPTQADAHGSHSVTQASAHASRAGTTNVVGGVTTDPFTTLTHSGFNADAHSLHTNFNVDAHAAHDGVVTLPPFVGLAHMELLGIAFTTTRTWTTGEIVTAAYFNTYIRDNQLALFAGQFPIGGIANWANSTASIPAHWQLCNGTNGTPDMRNYFAEGAQLVTTGSDGVTNAGNNQLTSASANWTSAIVGRMIEIGLIFRIITAVNNPNTLTYSGVTLGTLTGQTYYVGVSPSGVASWLTGAQTPAAHADHGVTQPSGHTAHVVTQPADHPNAAPLVTTADSGFLNSVTHHFTVDSHTAHAFTVDAHSAHASINTLPSYKSYAFIQRLS